MMPGKETGALNTGLPWAIWYVQPEICGSSTMGLACTTSGTGWDAQWIDACELFGHLGTRSAAVAADDIPAHVGGAAGDQTATRCNRATSDGVPSGNAWSKCAAGKSAVRISAERAADIFCAEWQRLRGEWRPMLIGNDMSRVSLALRAQMPLANAIVVAASVLADSACGATVHT